MVTPKIPILMPPLSTRAVRPRLGASMRGLPSSPALKTTFPPSQRNCDCSMRPSRIGASLSFPFSSSWLPKTASIRSSKPLLPSSAFRTETICSPLYMRLAKEGKRKSPPWRSSRSGCFSSSSLRSVRSRASPPAFPSSNPSIRYTSLMCRMTAARSPWTGAGPCGPREAQAASARDSRRREVRFMLNPLRAL